MTALTRVETEARLRAVLRAKAGQFDGEDSLEGPGIVPMLAVVVEDAPQRHRIGIRRAAAVAVAVVVVLVLAVGGLMLTTRSGDDRQPAPSTLPPAAGALSYPDLGTVMAPSAVPDGMKLWSMQTNQLGVFHQFATVQLFGRVDDAGAPDPGLLIQTQTASPGAGQVPGATETYSVHGQPASVTPSKYGGSAPIDVVWIEDGVLVRVTVRGLSGREAATMLDAMRPKASGLIDGLDAASAPSDLKLLGEAAGGPASTSSYTFLVFGPSAPTLGDIPALTVSSTTAGDREAYFRGWLQGDGNRQESEHFDPGFGDYLTQADGTSIVVNSPTLSETELRTIAHSVTALTPTRANELKTEVDARLRALPLIATADANGVTLELRGTAQGPATVCATVTAQAVSAAPAAYDNGKAGPRVGTYASVLLDHQWLLFGASPFPVSITTGRAERPQDPDPVVPGLVTGALGPWTFASSVIPDGTTAVSITIKTSESTSAGFAVTDPR